MRIYSDILKQFYPDVKACEKAEAEYAIKKAAEEAKFEADKKALEEKVAAEKAAISKKKKEMADAIELAQEEYAAACKVYDVARKQASDILKKAREEADSVLSVAAKEVEKASEKKMTAVRDFNKSFGVYKTTLTGAKAVEEYNRVVNNFFNHFWDWTI